MIEAENTLETARAKPRRIATKRLKTRLIRLSSDALDALEFVLTDADVKTSDRLSAIKLTFDLVSKYAADDSPAERGTLRVVFDGVEKELAE